MASKEFYGETNAAFDAYPDIYLTKFQDNNNAISSNNTQPESGSKENIIEPKKRDSWGNGMEFLMSCIAMSVGLGNIWRFPFTAYKNGGGAFLIPYLIVLFLIGKPLYFLEMVIGQFSSKGCVKVYDFSPAMRGSGTGQTFIVLCVMTYYASLIAIVLYYMFASFSSVLPWSVCDPSWTNCYPSGNSSSIVNATGFKSSSEMYFRETVLHELKDIDHGIGSPDWKLTLCLLTVWIIIFLVILKGVKSSGKAAYFLAIFPYLILLVLLGKAVTLPGSLDGIIFFIKPDFQKILDPQVWYAAVTQCFFSLNLCFGNVIMYSSYNDFKHNVYRDAMIVTSMDTVTSLIAGFTIFGILGNLARETGLPVETVIKGGTELTFISYPDAISKFQAVPQLFSFLFFMMMLALGIGSVVALVCTVITVGRDKFPNLKRKVAATIVCSYGFLMGLVYMTPGGQFIITLVDHHGGTFIAYFLAIGEIVAILWIYGVRRLCEDVEFMLGIKLSFYWRICWSIVTPLLLIIIFVYSLITLAPVTHNKMDLPTSAIASGWVLTALGAIQLPICAFIAILKRREISGFMNKIYAAFTPSNEWGPVDPETKEQWIQFKEMKEKNRENQNTLPKWRRIFNDVFGY